MVNGWVVVLGRTVVEDFLNDIVDLVEDFLGAVGDMDFELAWADNRLIHITTFNWTFNWTSLFLWWTLFSNWISNIWSLSLLLRINKTTSLHLNRINLPSTGVFCLTWDLVCMSNWRVLVGILELLSKWTDDLLHGHIIFTWGRGLVAVELGVVG